MRLNGQQIVALIIRANSQRDKVETLREVRSVIESLLVQARICQETGGFRSFASFATIIELAGDVARQNEGWLKSSGAHRAPELPVHAPEGVR